MSPRLPGHAGNPTAQRAKHNAGDINATDAGRQVIVMRLRKPPQVQASPASAPGQALVLSLLCEGQRLLA